MAEKISIVCQNCRAKYKVTVQAEVDEQISFACRKCGTLIEFSPGAPKTSQEQTTELYSVVCKGCGNEFVKNVEDGSELCYQCRIDQLIQAKREREEKAKAEAEEKARTEAEAAEKARAEAEAQSQPAAPAQPEPAAEPFASRYTFRNSEGLVLGPIKLRTVAVLVREKRILGNEEVDKDNEGYRPLNQFPELLEFFPQLGQQQESAPAVEEINLEEPPSAPEPVPPEPPAPEPPAPAPTEPIMQSEQETQSVPEPAPEPAAVIPSESEAESLRMAEPETPVAQPPEPPAREIAASPAPEPKAYHLKSNGRREFGPVRKNTVLDLIACGFLTGTDQVTRDKNSWVSLAEDEEFKGLVPAELSEVVDLVEPVDD
jgi:hypothetical protein